MPHNVSGKKLETIYLALSTNRGGKQVSRPRKFTEKRKKLFLQVLSEQANISQACRAVNIDRQTAYNAKEDDAEFAEAWDNAHEQAIDRLEAEAWRRAHDGDRKSVV